MNAATFNIAIAALDRDLADHRAVFRLVLRSYVSAPSWRYVQELQRHYRRITAIEQEQARLATAYHFVNWRE